MAYSIRRKGNLVLLEDEDGFCLWQTHEEPIDLVNRFITGTEKEIQLLLDEVTEREEHLHNLRLLKKEIEEEA